MAHVNTEQSPQSGLDQSRTPKLEQIQSPELDRIQPARPLEHPSPQDIDGDRPASRDQGSSRTHGRAHQAGSGRRQNESGSGPRQSQSGSKRGPVPREVRLSKQLSRLLRHAAVDEGLAMDARGFVNCADVLAWHPLRSAKLTFSELQGLVHDNAKQRFELISISSPNTSSSSPSDPVSANASSSQKRSNHDRDIASQYLIRASQGHSISLASESLLTPILPNDEHSPRYAVHGTDRKAWTKIQASGGISRMDRTHVHFAPRVDDSFEGDRPLPDSSWSVSSRSALSSTDALNGLTLQDDQSNKPKETSMQAENSSAADAVGNAVIATPDANPVISGMRASASILLWVDLKASAQSNSRDQATQATQATQTTQTTQTTQATQATEDDKAQEQAIEDAQNATPDVSQTQTGLSWWRSANGVILTEGDANGMVPLRYIVAVEERSPRGRRAWS